MVETIELPRAIRTCPECGAGMVAQRASRGEGWIDASLRFLFCCQRCQHQAVLETVKSENLTIVASAFVVLAGCAAFVYLPLSGGVLLGSLFVLIGASSLWFTWRAARMYRPKKGQQHSVQTVEVEDKFFVKEVEKSRHYWMQKYGSKAIYGILLITALIVLADWFGV